MCDEQRDADERDGAPFGVRAVAQGFTSREAVLEALRFQYKAKVLLKRHLFLGEILLLQGAITQSQHRELVSATGANHEEAEDLHAGRFFGDVAVELELCTPEQVFEALNRQLADDQQGERHRLIGEILFDLGHLSEANVRTVVDQLVDRMQTSA